MQLDQLEEKSIYLLRETAANFKGHFAMLWSIGKDSTVLLHLARKAFCGMVPFPLMHIDTSHKIPDMIKFRDKTADKLQLDLIVGQNLAALKLQKSFPDGNLSRTECCQLLKTDALIGSAEAKIPRLRYNHQTKKYTEDKKNEVFRALIMGIRSDEEGSRSKERYFSIRSPESNWNINSMPPELWNEFNTQLMPGQSVRIHPLLDWTELNIWQYIEREKISVSELYFDQGNGERYRSLGCAPCTNRIKSKARSATDIINELSYGALARQSERAGREQDKEGANSLESLRRRGYM